MQKDRPSRIASTSTLQQSRDQLFVLWNGSEKPIPPYPGPPESFPEDDERHWYDKEYAGWNAVKLPQPASAADGPMGKEVVFVRPWADEYQELFSKSLRERADQAGVRLTILTGDRHEDNQASLVDRALAASPDMIILNPKDQDASHRLLHRIHSAGTPVIACNFLPDSRSFPYLLAWTGPDDWGQSRLLAREFSRMMDRRGRYVIIRHFPESSSYYARTWGLVSELKKLAPAMECLDMASPGLDAEETEARMRGWLERYGDAIGGVVCADDAGAMVGVHKALEDAGRIDVKCVAWGSSNTGVGFVRSGVIQALAFQSPAIDGNTAMQTCIDWFQGLEIEPIRYLPKFIINRENVRDFADQDHQVYDVNLDMLVHHIERFEWVQIYEFFGDCYMQFIKLKVVPEELFQGFCLEILATLFYVTKRNSLNLEEVLGSYAELYKNISRQPSIGATFEWFVDVSLKLVESLKIGRAHV